jgi:HD superfamily phosphodiesterase
MEVITLAAWLHDLAKPGVAGIPAQHHGVVSAELAVDVLSEEGIDPDVISQVLDVIRKHVGLTIKEPLEPIEAQILWEADKILKLGMIGFIQGLLNGVQLFPGRGLREISEGLHEFFPLASDIVNCMETKKGKELANERLRTLKTLVKYLDNELEPTR